MNNLSKQEAIIELQRTFGYVRCLCGSDEVTLMNSATKNPMKREIVMYINGVVKGEWLSSKSNDHEAKYLVIKRVRTFKKKEITRAPKSMQKNMKEAYFEYKSCAFGSARTAINHILKVCPTAVFRER